MSLSLDALNDDILICVFTALSIPDIFLLRQVSRRLYHVSEQHAVWKTVCTNDVLRNGFPFPKRPLASFSPKDLERQTVRAYKLGVNWRSPKTSLHHAVSTHIMSGTIADIKFLSRLGRTWIITTSIGIWWTLWVRDCDSLKAVAAWGPDRAAFGGLAINSDNQSDAAIAISVHRADYATVELLTIIEDDASSITVQSLRTLETSSKPIGLNGDIIALCDHDSETTILNWKTQEQALLRSPNTWQDKPSHVTFVNGYIFVVRARSICIFEEPQMVPPGNDLNVILPCLSKSFGWVDGIALALGHTVPFCPAGSPRPPLSLLIRNKGDDSWRPTDRFQLMTLNADFSHSLGDTSNDTSAPEQQSPSFPFNLITTHSFRPRGPLRCSDMVLGPYGTAVWVHPPDWAGVGLVVDEGITTHKSEEMLIVALLPGLLNQGSTEEPVKVVLENSGGGWSCMDYDETLGLIALGSGTGVISLYRL